MLWGRLKTCRNQFMQVERKRPHVYNRKQCVVGCCGVVQRTNTRNVYYDGNDAVRYLKIGQRAFMHSDATRRSSFFNRLIFYIYTYIGLCASFSM